MKKQEYLTPETLCVFVEIEATLCQSAGGEFEGFDPIDTEFPMFSVSSLDSIL